MAKYRVIVTDNRHGNYNIEEEILRSCDAELIIENCVSNEDVITACQGVDGVLLDLSPMPAEVIKNIKGVRVISRYGVGYDNVDAAACTAEGIYLANVPDYCEEDVSDMALAHLFCSLRQVASRDSKIRRGDWNLYREKSFRLKGKTLSLLGYGRIARCLHRKTNSFGLKEVLVYDPYVEVSLIEKAGGRAVGLEEALRLGDIISLHMPVTEETTEIINSKTLSLMKKTAILINTSRGDLVEHKALVDTLKNEGIAFAGLDTHHQEPLPQEDPLLTLDNCVLTDHTGFNTREGVTELKTKAALNVKDVLTGGVPKYWINRF